MRRVAFAILLSISVSALPALAATPPRTGENCGKKGLVKIYKGKSFTCLKSRKGLEWSKGVRISRVATTRNPTPSPSPTPTQAPAPEPTSSLSPTQNNSFQNSPCEREHEVKVTDYGSFRCERRSDTGLLLWNTFSQIAPSPGKTFEPEPTSPPLNSDVVKSREIEYCKMREQNANRLSGYNDLATGFPRIKPFMMNRGEMKWAVVPIDFVDLPGEAEFKSRVIDQTELATEWLYLTSSGQVRLTWYVHEKWVRLPGSFKQFILERGQTHNTVQNELIAKLWNLSIEESDKQIDFKGIHGVHFILPKGQDFLQEAAKGHAWGWDDVVSKYITNEGTRIDFFTIPGVFYDDYFGEKRYWSYWVKEYTRGLGAGSIGPRYGDGNYNFMPYDIQANTEGSRYLSGWNRFVMDWIPETQIFCASLDELSNFEIDLHPLLSDSGKTKVALIKVSPSKMLIIESRRDDKFSCGKSSRSPTRDGILVYTYDALLSPGEPFLNVVAPTGRQGDSMRFCEMLPPANVLLTKGDFVTFEGVKIESVFSGSFDRIRITK